MKIILAILFSTFIFNNSFCQKKKQMLQEGVKMLSVYEIQFKKGKEIKILKLNQKFNDFGKISEMIEYDDNGRFKKKEVYEYNDYMKKINEKIYSISNSILYIKHIEYNNLEQKVIETTKYPNGKILKIERYKYNENLISEKTEYNSQNKIITKTVYDYLK